MIPVRRRNLSCSNTTCGGTGFDRVCVLLEKKSLCNLSLSTSRVSPSAGSRKLVGQRVDCDWRPVLHKKSTSMSLELRGVGEAATLAVGVLELQLELQLPGTNAAADGSQTRFYALAAPLVHNLIAFAQYITPL